jgi:heptosyltransferase I
VTAPHLLLVKTSSMGDLVHTLSALEEARLQVPGLSVDWVAEEAFADVARLSPAVCAVIPVAQRRWRQALVSPATRAQIAAFARRLRATHYDLVIDAQGLFKSAWITRLARCRRGQRWGYDWASARESVASLVVDHRVNAPTSLHAIERLRQLFGAALGYTPAGPVPYLHLHTSDPTQRDIFFLHGTSRPEKSWPLPCWIEAGRTLAAQGYTIALPWGSSAEQQASIAIAKGVGDSARVLPRQSIAELADAFRHAAGVIGVDTGLMHLSVAIGCPTVAVMSAGHLPRFVAHRFAPYQAAHARVVVGTQAAPQISADGVLAQWQALRSSSARDQP